MIKLNLRTHLAAVTLDKCGEPGNCTYSSPCIIGAMLTDEQRRQLRKQDCDSAAVSNLARGNDANGIPHLFDIPGDQLDDFTCLQNAFDRNRDLEGTLARMKEKYSV